MKKTIFAVAALTIALAGCDNASEDATTGTDAPQAATEQAPVATQDQSNELNAAAEQAAQDVSNAADEATDAAADAADDLKNSTEDAADSAMDKLNAAKEDATK